jgi:hypothetical protein
LSTDVSEVGGGSTYIPEGNSECHLIVSKVVIQVVVFLWDDISEVVLGACYLPFSERVGTNCVCMYKVFLLRLSHGVIKVLRSFLWSIRVPAQRLKVAALPLGYLPPG